MKIIFMGTPHFATMILAQLLRSEHELIAVYSKEHSPVAIMANARGVPLHTPPSLKGYIVKENADIAIVAAYGLILPESFLNSFKYGCINVHPSILPRWRGAAPIERAIMAGDRVTGVAIMQMDAGLDTGDIFYCQEVPILAHDTGRSLSEKLAIIGCRLLLQTLRNITTITPVKQSGEVIYAHKISKDDELIDWGECGSIVERKIRALSQTPCAYCFINEQRVKIIEADFVPGPVEGRPGAIINKKMHIAVIGGVIIPKIVQRAGGKRLAIDEFLRGNKL